MLINSLCRRGLSSWRNTGSTFAVLGTRSLSSTTQTLENKNEVVLSGIQCSGVPTLGNYIGALKQWVDLQDEHEHAKIFYAAVDHHTLTVPRSPEELNTNVSDTILSLLACGVDPTKSSLFIQSHVHQHTELAWILSCVAQFSDLRFMTQWKTKSKGKSLGSLGLFSYPVLMAADILLYKTTVVPVGDDQIQHLELTKTIARAFNRTFESDALVIPEARLGSSPRIMSLRDPTSKMSKSDKSALSRILLTDTTDDIAKKIRKAKTDNINDIYFEKEERPGVSNLLQIYATLSNMSIDEAEIAVKGLNKEGFKDMVTQSIIDELSPIQERMEALRQDNGFVDNVLQQGSAAAREVADNTVKEVKVAMGMSIPSY